MSRYLATALFSTSAIVGLVTTFPVAAQPQQAAGTANPGIEEIVVTARRHNERVQSVPMAISAFSQKDLESKNIEHLSDLTKAVPSLSFELPSSDPNGPNSSNVRLRGLPGTVVYFNDVPIGSTDYNQLSGAVHALSPGFLYDLDHLEVDKGPQGTLFGKNSIGGVISYQPQHPTNEFEGYGQVTLGNYNDREFEGAVNIPVVEDKLLVRVAGQTQQRDGYTTDLSTGKDLDNRDFYAWRIGVTLRPSDDFENYFLYDGYYQHTNGSSEITRYVNPALFLAYGGLFPNASALVARQQRLGARTELGSGLPLIGKDYFYGFTDVARWDISDSLTLKNIAAARVFKQLATFDDAGLGGLPLLTQGDPVNSTGWTENSVQYTEELQLQGKALNDKLSWVLGGYLEFDHPLGENDVPSTALGGISYYHFSHSERSQAVFIHGIYDLSDYVEGLRFTAGYRYTWDYASVSAPGTNGVDHVLRDATGAAINCAPAFGADNNCFAGADGHYSSFGWNVGLDEQITPNTLLYVRSGNAYRPGTVNPAVLADFQHVKPEHVTDVEVGVKSDWELFGNHMRTNADFFHTDYKAIQVNQLVQVVAPDGTIFASNETLNAATAELQGAELDAVLVPFTGVEISPHASYIFAQYGTYPAAFGSPSSEAPPFFYVPKWQYGITGTYHLPVDDSVGQISASLSYSWTGHVYVSVTPGETANIVPSFENIDLRVEWSNMFGQPIDAAAFVTNLTDNTHITGIIPTLTSLGFAAVNYNEPRMFGFSLKYRFGGPSQSEEPQTPYVAPAVVAPKAAVPKSYLVFFDFNRSDLTPQATAIVDQAATNVTAASVSKLEVTGHTDTVGSDAYNMRLSKRRAEAVAAQLEKDGIPSSEIEIVAKGKRDLLVPTADGVREPQNRRVQILYSGGASS